MATEHEKAIVRTRAGRRCEYCQAPEDITAYAFHIEHIKPRNEGGKDEIENYALSCQHCNRSKWYYQTGKDPKTGKEELLFNPRKDEWMNHFRMEKQIYIRGKTPVGRATENQLQLNQKRQLEARLLWQELDLYP
jgi:hypothetical protein